DGVDHPNDHVEPRFGSAERVTDLPPSTFAFVLRRSTTFCRRSWTPASREGVHDQLLVERPTKNNPMLIRQKESDLLAKLANMLRAEEQRPKSGRDDEWTATINGIREDLKRKRKQGEKRGQCAPTRHGRATGRHLATTPQMAGGRRDQRT